MEDGFDPAWPATRCRCCAPPRASACVPRTGRSARATPSALAEMAKRCSTTCLRLRGRAGLRQRLRQLLRDLVEAHTERAAAEPAAATVEVDVDRLADPLAEGVGQGKDERELQVKAQVMPLLMQRIDVSAPRPSARTSSATRSPRSSRRSSSTSKSSSTQTELRSMSAAVRRRHRSASGRSSRCSRTRTISDIMINGCEDASSSSARAGWSSPTSSSATTPAPAADHRPHRRPPSADASTSTSPMVDARLADGSRVQRDHPAAGPRRPGDLDPPVRHHADHARGPIVAGSSPARARFLEVMRGCVQARLNIIISGGTGSGKTTLLNCLSRYIPDGERDHHDRGRGRAPAPAAARRAPRDPPDEHRGQGRDHPARPRQELPADAPRPRSSSARSAAARRSTCSRP